MRKQHIFTGIMMLGLGLFFFLQQTDIAFLKQFNEWPIMLLIPGVALLAQAYAGKNNEVILPGVLLFGFGLHFTLMQRLSIWPNHTEVFLLILATGFLLRYQKTRDGLFYGLFFLLIALLHFFYDAIIGFFPTFASTFAFIWQFWPILFIVLGIYTLLVQRK